MRLLMFVRLASQKNTSMDNQKRLWISTFLPRELSGPTGSQYAAPTGADMKRVSTAFVGQVSAASSPAIAKLKGRARATNDSAYVPLASSHRAQSRRRRDPGRDLPRRTGCPQFCCVPTR